MSVRETVLVQEKVEPQTTQEAQQIKVGRGGLVYGLAIGCAAITWLIVIAGVFILGPF